MYSFKSHTEVLLNQLVVAIAFAKRFFWNIELSTIPVKKFFSQLDREDA
ncbi:hypothetical protein LYNGBM3L_37450 [Moorena producens 3L]|uniref:Uncharacterized protein n=1 Tax=Moorena producens 3L TaxID=489825 RepID=F4XQ13_9CYAN|nr:hypothetical protein LYNGBM3L_37450 [Moorena producens 3L]